MATGLFDDLIPQAPTNTAGAFSDLIPEAGLRARNPEQAALEEEQSQPTLERLGLRAALGAGEEGKGALRVAIGNVLDYVSKNLHPGTMMLERQRGSEPVTRSIRALGQGVAELGRENIAEARELGQAVGGGKAGDVIQALGTTFTVSAPAIPAAMLGGLPAAAATAGATQFGSSMEQFRQQLIQRGETPEDAERKATLPAMISGAITATLTRAIPGGAEMLMNRLAAGETAQGVGRFLGKLISREIPLEMGEEGADQLGQSIVERVMVNPNKTLEETINETVFAMGAAGLLTGLIGGVTAGTMKAAEKAGDIAEDVSFNRRSRRIADVRSRLGMTPTGQTTTTERTIDATPQRPQQVSVPAQRLQTTPGGATTEAGPGDQLQPATQEAQTPIDTSTLHVTVNAPQQIPNGPLVPGFVQIDEVIDGQNTRSGMAKVMQDAGMTVPDFSSLPQGRYTYPQALERLAALQGDRRSPPQALVEGRTPIPAVPPAIQFSGLSIPVEQLPLAERIKQKVVEENRLATGLPILNIRVVRSGPADPAIYTVPSSGGFDTVNVDLEKLGRQLQAEGLDIEQYLALATNEEIVHNAGGAVAYDRWQSEGRQGAFPVFYNQLMQAIHDEMTPTQRTEVKNLYGVAGLDMAPVRIAEEHFRMIMQGKLKGGITEQTIGRQTLEFIKAMIKRLQEILGFETNPDRQRLIEGYITQGLNIIQSQQPRGPRERFQTDAGPTATTEPEPQEESPFDRMRRESGAEPPPELTPEQEAARERNERRRTMRPNPRFAGAANPLDRLSAEDGDDVWIETKVAGTTDNVRDRIPVTPESTTASQQHAKKIFDEAGVNVTWLEHTPPNPETGQPSKGIWKYTKEENEEGGRKLAQLLERELSGPNTDERVLLLGSLVNSIRYNDKLGNAEGVFDLPTRKALYAMSQAEASIRGALLQELNQHPAAIKDVARNVDLALHRIWHTAFGGEVIDGVMAEIRKGTQAFMTKPLINQILANNPELQNALDLVTSLSEREDALPDAATLVDLVFKSPFYKLSDFGKALEKMLIKKYDVNPSNAAAIAKEFQKAFDPSLKQGATEALKIATANIPYDKKAKVKGKKSIDKLVQDAINKGALESGEVLRNIAKEQGWNPPSDEEIDRMKKLSDRLTSLRNHSPEALAEYKKTNASEQEIESARQIKEAGLSSEINRVRKEMEIAWARMTKPINIWRGLPFIGNPEIRANNARAINEFIAANLLSKPGFFTRQVAAILSQWLSFVPTRSIANAIVNHQHAKNWQERQPFLKEVASQLRDGYKSQYAAMKSAIAAAQAGLLGRGEQRTVLNLTSALSALDRLTKQAEEAWAAGDYGRAGLLYFLSSIKMGYRIAQGLDRLQGVPAHYQNMRAQVLRGLMDAGKTRAEAETSADLVLDIIKQEWALALVRARDLLNEAGVTPTAQAIRQNAAQIVKRKAYQKIQELGLPADAFEEESSFMENTIGWNQREVKGVGGALARGLRQLEKVAEAKGVPLVATRFSNAIGISINRALAFTPLWQQADYGGRGDSAWFSSEVDRAQRRVEGYVGTSLGAIALMMAMTGTWAVRLKWPKDKEERDIFEREGHRPNTVEIPISETEFIPISLNNSPFMFVAPYLAAGGALREKLDEKAKLQATRDRQAAELGVTAEKVPGLSSADLGLVALAAAQQSILGGRTVAGLIGSMTSYGAPNAKKTVASYTSALIPWLPGSQEVSRMAGVSLDERAASIGDLMLPLPTSGARKLNLLGDPVRTPNDIQRVSQIMSGGTSIVPVNTADAKSEAAYRALIESGFRPPSISANQGYLIDGTIRPMKGIELQRYTEARGRLLKEALSSWSSTGNADEDKAQARKLYQTANAQALQEVNAAPIPKYSASAPSAPSLPRAPRPRSGIRRLRSPRLRGGRIRRIRTARSSRRVRRPRSVRLAA